MLDSGGSDQFASQQQRANRGIISVPLVPSKTCSSQVSSVQHTSSRSIFFRAAINWDSTHRVFEFCLLVEVSTDIVLSSSSSSGSEVVSALLSVPNDVLVLGQLSVTHVALFGEGNGFSAVVVHR